MIENQAVCIQAWLKGDTGLGDEAGQVHGDGAIGREAQVVIAIPPIFDKSDVWMRLGRGTGHEFSLPRSNLETNLHRCFDV